jgi:hypothetical protein
MYMSGNRLRTDFGPLSLDLVETRGLCTENFCDAKADDVVRLKGLLSTTTKRTREESSSREAIGHHAVNCLGSIGDEIKTRLNELIDVMTMAVPGMVGPASHQTSIAICLAGIGKITAAVDYADGKIAFELQANEPVAHEWLESILDLLHQQLTVRLEKPVQLRILVQPAREVKLFGTADQHRATA